MKIAIYSRKSKTTDKGDSIANQIHLCKEYALTHFDSPEFFVFEDEGFSGSTINRPQFQLLLSELKQGLYSVLMCYRLDRISRNVSDFSSTLDLLTKHNIGFVSIKENFDTTTPMGRAMIHISSVFAQLERETIAERIKDNMLELAKTGRWLGGTPPLGYRSKKVHHEINGKLKSYTHLEVDTTTAPLVKMIYDTYLELGSISKVETYLLQKGIKTPNNAQFHSNVIRGILINPVYCSADKQIYHYFYTLNSILSNTQDDFTGHYALMPYNRHKGGHYHMKNAFDEWIISIGIHAPIIDSSTWLMVQRQLKLNSSKSIPTAGTSQALLTGLIYCKKCGSIMKVTNQSVLVDGTISFTYRCTTKLKSRGKVCNVKNISKGYELDTHIINYIKQMLQNESDLVEKLLHSKNKLVYNANTVQEDKDKLLYKVSTNEENIKNLIHKLTLFNDVTMLEYIHKEVTRLHTENVALKTKIKKLEEETLKSNLALSDTNLLLASLKDFDNSITHSTIHQKRELIRHIIKHIDWDGENVDVYFYLNSCPL